MSMIDLHRCVARLLAGVALVLLSAALLPRPAFAQACRQSTRRRSSC